MNITNSLLFFFFFFFFFFFLVIKNENPLPVKDSHILSTNNNSVLAIVVGIYLKHVEVLTMTLS